MNKPPFSLASTVVAAVVVPPVGWALIEHLLRLQGLSLGPEGRVLVIAGLVVVAAAGAVRRVQRALGAWSNAAAAREADAFAPLPEAPLQEFMPAVQALNATIARQRAEMDAHKRTMADASHQLRTPLAVLRTQLQAALDGDGSLAVQVPEMLRTVDRATGVALEMLTRLKIEQRERQALPWSSLHIEDLAKEAAIEFAPLIAQKRLDFALDADATEVVADAWMLGELVRNLLANAIQHSPLGAALGIVVRRVAGRAELIVWDCGSGISDAQRERLFEPFAAAEGGTGVGLGLSICRQFARALGAEVELYDRIDGGRLAGVDALVRWDTAAAPSRRLAST